MLKKSQQKVFEELTDEQAGKLIKGIFKYVITGKSELEGLLNVVFIPIKEEIDKNEKAYQKKCEKNKENIRRRWNTTESEGTKSNTTECEEIRKDTNVYECIRNDTDNNHISYIINQKEDKKDIRGMGEEEKEEEKLKAESQDNYSYEIKKVIEHLNKVTGSNYKSSTKTTREKIKARLNEGYKLDDFIVVIDKKYKEWNKTEFKKYLRPETLFGTKFEGYLNQFVKKVVTTKDLEDKIDLENF